MTELELKKTANEVRKNIVTAVYHAHSGHPGGSLSAADILTYLYFEEMNVEPKDPRKADRDRFVLSKGHAAPGLYSALAERGYIDKEELKSTIIEEIKNKALGKACIIKSKFQTCVYALLGISITWMFLYLLQEKVDSGFVYFLIDNFLNPTIQNIMCDFIKEKIGVSSEKKYNYKYSECEYWLHIL